MTTVYFDMTNLEEVAREMGLGTRRIEDIAQQTMNRALQRGRTAAARRFRDAVQQPYNYALAKIGVSKVSFQAGKHYGEISAARQGLRLSRYDYRQLARGEGVAVSVGRGRGYKAIQPAFLFRSKAGVELIGFRKPGSKRYNALYGPSPSQVFGQDRPVLAEDLDDFMAVEIARRLQVELGQYNGKIT